MTVHGATGTIDIADIVADNGVDLLEIIGKSLAFVGTNAFIGAHHGAEIMVAIAPPWAELIAATLPGHRRRAGSSSTSTRSCPSRGGRRRTSGAPSENRRVDEHGDVHLVEDPEHMLVIVNGGLGNLHALALHSFGPTQAVTRSF